MSFLDILRIKDFYQFWDVSIDEVRSNLPTAEYTHDMVREITILINEVRMFSLRIPTFYQDR